MAFCEKNGTVGVVSKKRKQLAVCKKCHQKI